MPKTKAASPARSQGGIPTPKRKSTRSSRSLCSPALSTASGRLTSLIDQFKDKNMESFALSPLNGRSVLNDNTEIEEPRRKSWWKKLDENSQDVMEVLEDNKLIINNAIEEFADIEVLSQEKKNYTLDLPESSDNESINSIVLPQRRLFTQKENQPQKKFGHLIDNRESLAKLPKTNTTNFDKSVNVGTRELFRNAKRSKPIFPAALLNISPNKTAADKTKENVVADPKPQVRNIFGNRPANKRKNMFADFIVSESEDEISEIQPKVFGFQKKFEQRRFSSASKGRDPSPSSSITTDIEMDFRNMLPSSTMVENQLEDMMESTPVKRTRLSKLSEAKESEAGTNTLQTNSTVGDKTRQSNKSASSKNKSKASPETKDKSLNSSRTTRSMFKNTQKREESVNFSVKQDAKDNKSHNKSKGIDLDVSTSKSDTDKERTDSNKSKKQNKSRMTNSSRAIETEIESEETGKVANAINNLTRVINKTANKSLPNTTATNKSVNEKERTVTLKVHDKLDKTGSYDIASNEEEDDENNFTLEYENDDNEGLAQGDPNQSKRDNTIKQKSVILEKDTQNSDINKSKSNKSSITNKSLQKIQTPVKTVEESVESQTEQYSADDNVDGVQDQVDQEIDEDVNNSREDNNKKIEQDNEDTVNKSIANDKEANESEENEDEANVSQENEDKQNESEDVAMESQEVDNEENEAEEDEEDGNESENNEDEASESHEVEAEVNESQEIEEDANESQEVAAEENKCEETKDDANESQEVAAEENESQEIKEDANESQAIEKEVDESQEVEEEANESQENAETANYSEEVNAEVNENEEVNAEVNESQEVEEEANESQDIEGEANETQDVEEDANESQENTETANKSEEVNAEVNENEEVNAEVNESQEVEDEANESQDIEEDANESQDIEEDANESQDIEEEANESQEVEDDDAQDGNAEVMIQDEEEAANESQVNEASTNESQEVANDEEETNELTSEAEVNESDEEDQQMDDSDEADKAIASDPEISDDNQADEMEVDDDEEQESENESDQNEHESHEERQIEEQNEIEASEEIEESPNVTHDTTGRHRKKHLNKSPEVILHDKTNQMDSFTAKGRNTSVRKTKSMISKSLNIRPSLAPHRDSTGFSDGTRNSSAEGSGWDSHRTTRKTLRQTFGKDFTPRKSLRALVMEKSAKRQTEHVETHSETVKFPLANSTEMPEDSNLHVEDVVESDHEMSRQTRLTALEIALQKIKEQNIEKRLKLEAAVRNSLKNPPTNSLSLFKVPNKPAPRRLKPAQIKPKKQMKSLIPLDELPAEVIQDMKYKPPKRFRPSNASWITKRLYKFLEEKLEAKYDYKARVRAEKLAETLYNFTKDLRRHNVAPTDAVEVLKHEFARLEIVRTHFEFYEFFHEFMPREVRIKVVPDIVNKISLPRHGVFSDILRD